MFKAYKATRKVRLMYLDVEMQQIDTSEIFKGYKAKGKVRVMCLESKKQQARYV